MQEYKRCAHALKEVSGPRASFLRCYATYLLGEARKEEERLEAGGLLGNGQAVNKVPSHVISAHILWLGLPGQSCLCSSLLQAALRHAMAHLTVIDGCHEITTCAITLDWCCCGRCPVSQASLFWGTKLHIESSSRILP